MKPFKIIQKDLGTKGQLRFSRADGDARIEARTKGIALKYVLQGREHYDIGGKQLDLYAGRFIILPEGMAFKAKSKELTTTGICLDLSGLEFARLFPEFESMDLLFGVPFQTLEHLELGSSIRQMEGVFTDDHEDKAIDNVYNALSEFCQLVSVMQEGLKKTYSKPNSRQQVLLRLLLAREYIYLNYSESLKLETLSSAVGISKSHLQRLFTTCFKISPKKLQQELRMNKALKLMKSDNYTLEDIAFELGYTDLAAFSNQFRTWHLTSPKKYRAMIA